MQHILNIAFDFDDAKIIKSVEGLAEKEIINMLVQKAEKAIFGRHERYYSNEKENYQAFASEHLSSFLEKHKETIIHATSNKLAEKVFKSKTFKESVENALGQK